MTAPNAPTLIRRRHAASSDKRTRFGRTALRRLSPSGRSHLVNSRPTCREGPPFTPHQNLPPNPQPLDLRVLEYCTSSGVQSYPLSPVPRPLSPVPCPLSPVPCPLSPVPCPCPLSPVPLSTCTSTPPTPSPSFQQIATASATPSPPGALPLPGDPIPSIRAQAVKLRINPNTIARAYEHLEREGLAHRVPQRLSACSSPARARIRTGRLRRRRPQHLRRRHPAPPTPRASPNANRRRLLARARARNPTPRRQTAALSTGRPQAVTLRERATTQVHTVRQDRDRPGNRHDDSHIPIDLARGRPGPAAAAHPPPPPSRPSPSLLLLQPRVETPSAVDSIDLPHPPRLHLVSSVGLIGRGQVHRHPPPRRASGPPPRGRCSSRQRRRCPRRPRPQPAGVGYVPDRPTAYAWMRVREVTSPAPCGPPGTTPASHLLQRYRLDPARAASASSPKAPPPSSPSSSRWATTPTRPSSTSPWTGSTRRQGGLPREQRHRRALRWPAHHPSCPPTRSPMSSGPPTTSGSSTTDASSSSARRPKLFSSRRPNASASCSSPSASPAAIPIHPPARTTLPQAPPGTVWSRLEGREWIVTVRGFTHDTVEPHPRRRRRPPQRPRPHR